MLSISGKRCALTGETLTELLEAAHVIPVTHPEGVDLPHNGLVLRVDLHRLFDAEPPYFWIDSNGRVVLAREAELSNDYRALLKGRSLDRTTAQRLQETLKHAQTLRQLGRSVPLAR